MRTQQWLDRTAQVKNKQDLKKKKKSQGNYVDIQRKETKTE